MMNTQNMPRQGLQHKYTISDNGTKLIIHPNVMINKDDIRACVKANPDVTSIHIGAHASIGGWAFGFCHQITSVTIEKNVAILTYAFSNTGLQSITISDNSKIGKWAFKDCQALVSLRTAKNVAINESAFEGCSSLRSINYFPSTDIISVITLPPVAAYLNHNSIPGDCRITRQPLTLFLGLPTSINFLTSTEKHYIGYLWMSIKRWATGENKPQIPFEILTHIISQSQLCIPQVTTTAANTQPLALTALQRNAVSDNASLEQYDRSLFSAPRS